MLMGKRSKQILAVFSLFLATVFIGQNCTQDTTFEDAGSLTTVSILSAEDEFWFGLQSAEIKIRQLEAIAGFSDQVSREVLEGKTPIVLANELKTEVTEIRAMIGQQSLPVNSHQVTRKYARMIDLLSQARDMLLAYYMNLGFEQVAKDLAEAKQSLESSINLLAASQDELRLAQERLRLRVDEQDQAMRAMRIELIREIQSLEARLNKKIDDLQVALNNTINRVNDELTGKIAKNAVDIATQAGQIVNLQAEIRRVEQELKPQIQYLNTLTADTRKDLDEFRRVFEDLRNSGDTTYQQTLTEWNCRADLIDKGGSTTLGLPASISEACVQSKEATLYQICVDRYPTFCGPCDGKSMETCEHWNNPTVGLSPREKLEVLINIRQEIAIEHLMQKTTHHNEYLFGKNSCKQECVVASTDMPASCTIEDLNDCGVEGRLLALQISDRQMNERITQVSANLSTQLGSLENQFQLEREYSNQRFASLQTHVDSELSKMKQTTEARFAQVASALSGLPMISPSLKDEVTRLSALSAMAEQQAANDQALIPSSLIRLNGFNTLSANQINQILNVDIETLLKIMSEGAIGQNGAVGSTSSVVVALVREVFDRLNADQEEIPEYNQRLMAAVQGVCPAESIMETPFTNVVGRDSMELIAIGVARKVILGDGPVQVAGNNTIFRDYQGSLVKGSKLQQAFFSTAFDYRKDFEVSVPGACLDAIDTFVTQLFNGSETIQRGGQGPTVIESLTSTGMLQHTLALRQQMEMIMNRLVQLERTILNRAVVDVNSQEYQNAISSLVIRLIQANSSKLIAKMLSDELISLISIQKDMADSSFQIQFDRAINKYLEEKHNLAQTINNALLDIDVLRKDLTTQQGISQAQARELEKLGQAVGYLQAEQQNMRTEYDENIRKLEEEIERITTLIEQETVDSQFDPRIMAIRHTYAGAGSNCSFNRLSALAFPTKNQFVGDSLACQVNFRTVNGDPGRGKNWAFGLNAISNLWFKVWGSASTIDVELTVNGQNRSASLNLQGVAAGEVVDRGAHKVSLVSGSHAEGAFMLNFPTLFNGINTKLSSFDQRVHFTPVNASTGDRGPRVTYTAKFYSPLVLSFRKDGKLRTTSIEEGVRFDLMDLGNRQTTGWVNGLDGAFLAIDLDKNGVIDSGRELFGQATHSKDGKKFANGFDALAQYDSNKDGKIDHKDKAYSQLMLWFDLNNDGISQAKELKSLSELGVTEISLDYQSVPEKDAIDNGNKILYSATFKGPQACGDEGCKIYDVFFNSIEVSTQMAGR
jgi:hypothetical protein